MSTSNLLSVPTLVESPFVRVKIGEYEFGTYTRKMSQGSTHVKYPNYVKSLSAVKVNGSVNTYTIVIDYQVSVSDDPNMLDMIFSTAANNREISLIYGDWNAPSYVCREEKAIITDVRTQLDMSSSKITYTIQCTGNAVGLTSLQFNFPSRVAKPSEVLKEMIQSDKYGLRSTFKGMQDIAKVEAKGWITSTDTPVKLEAKNNMTPIAYMNYLVSCMRSSVEGHNSIYMFCVKEDYLNDNGGLWFEVIEITSSNAAAPSNSTAENSVDVYSIDINYPSDNLVTSFSINNDQSWSILYQYAENVKQEEYVYRIGDDGDLVMEHSPIQQRSSKTYNVSESKASWWRKMTSFPIEATLTIKGLIRSTILMSYVRLNVWFHGGQKHISSGLYVITKQQDVLDSSGYKTTLTLLRVGEDV